jgi:rhodanese-related sulfurtransferase
MSKEARQAKREPQAKQGSLLWRAGLVTLVLAIGAVALVLRLNGGVAEGRTTSAGDKPPTKIAALADDPQRISPDDYQSSFSRPQGDHLLIDVRTPEEFNAGHIAGAVNIPLDTLPERLADFQTDKPIVLYCRSGNRSAQAAIFLDEVGVTGIYDLGGIIEWQAEGYPLE